HVVCSVVAGVAAGRNVMSTYPSASLSSFRQSPSSLKRLRRSLAASVFVVASQTAMAQTPVPNNANSACSVTQVEISNWFTSGTIAPNGGVDPADSITFPNVPNCSFYKWSEQMFLWLTSPVPTKYGGGTHVFNSPVFFDLSPADATTGIRTLVPNV